jgi:hypothetical protein
MPEKGSGKVEMLLFQLKRHVEYLLLYHVYNVHEFTSIEEAAELFYLPVNTSILRNRIKLMTKAMGFLKKSLRQLILV